MLEKYVTVKSDPIIVINTIRVMAIAETRYLSARTNAIVLLGEAASIIVVDLPDLSPGLLLLAIFHSKGYGRIAPSVRALRM